MNIRWIRIYHLVYIFGESLSLYMDIPQCQVNNRYGIFRGCNLTGIPLVQTDIGILDLGSNYILEINASSFPFLEKLFKLQIDSQKNEKLTIRNHSFRNLPGLIELDLSYNRMLILDSEAFAGLSYLQNLLLYYNNLTGSILENDYFKDLKSLEYLDLSSNAISYLKPNPLFYYLHNFHLLTLKYNHISRICEGDLHSFERKMFTVMDLSNNRLHESGPDVWKSCGKPFRNIQFDTLLLGSNGLNVDSLQSITSALNGTKIMHLKLAHHIMGASFGFHNLKDPDNTTFTALVNSDLQILDISDGSIFSLNPYTFANLSQLLLLNLAENKINRINMYAFHGLNSLLHLNLSNNLLGELYEYTFDGLPNVIHIYLQQNHIGAIRDAAFKQLTKLELLDLQDNAIKQIRFCEQINYVQVMYIGRNRLKAVGQTYVNTTYFDATQNNLENLGELYWLSNIPQIKGIILNQNRLSYCYPFFNISKTNSLIYLDLSENMIQLIWEKGQCLDVFHHLSRLKVLILYGNHFAFIPDGIFNGLSSLKNLNLSHNSLTYISNGIFPLSLEKLDLSNNQLLSPSPELFTSIQSLDITKNNFICDCTLVSFIMWLNETNTTLLGSPNDIYCMFPTNFLYQPLHKLNVDGCDEDLVLLPLRFSLFVFTTLIIAISVTSTIVYNHFRGTCFGLFRRITTSVLGGPKSEGSLEMHQYDAYLCYSKKDFQWVQNSFLENLDSHYCERNRFHLCFEERDFVPGEDHIMNIRQAIWNSRKTICIVSKHFLKDGWCIEAFNCAQSRYFTELKDVLIMVVVGTLSSFQLKRYEPIRAFVQRSQYMKWPEDSQDVDWFLGRLSYKILKEQNVKKQAKVTKIASTLELRAVATVS
ncbi:toll-like receptor 5 [Pelobates cultripes]|uniref:Toll-like receptor 5 n=1 Tax=Pelobates cultripes TaxID=61616 RepID=A0AAD1RGT7_PELCU|nr:toll-like receptor 5 [Pelobates cultripes]